jgi:protein involved in polysaccharide export with SLBB domain
MKLIQACLLFAVFAAALLRGADSSVAVDASRYRLYSRDLVRIAVQGEADVAAERRIDGLGEVFVPLLGSVKIAGLTPTEAQALIVKRYIQEDIFVRPEVVVSVIEYSPKEIMVLGQVSKQGKLVIPAEASGMSIVEAITSAGGFTRIAKSSEVRVTRKDERGVEQPFTVNVEKMIEGRSTTEAVMLQPGDVVFVPERVF